MLIPTGNVGTGWKLRSTISARVVGWLGNLRHVARECAAFNQLYSAVSLAAIRLSEEPSVGTERSESELIARYAEVLGLIIEIITTLLLIEAVLCVPVVLIGASRGDFKVMMDYLIPFLIAVIPFVLKVTFKKKISVNRQNAVVISLGTGAGVLFFLYFSKLILLSCSGHPPY